MFSTTDVIVMISATAILLTVPFKWFGLITLGLLGFYFYGPVLIGAAILRYQTWKRWGENFVLILLLTQENSEVDRYFFPYNPEVDDWFKKNRFHRSPLFGGYLVRGTDVDEVHKVIYEFKCETKVNFL